MITFLTLLLTAVIAVYVYVQRHFSYWQRHGFPYLKNIEIPYGNMGAHARKERSMGTAVWDLYNQTDEPFVGMYAYTNPGLLVRDLELVRKIMITDFDYFHDRSVYNNKDREPLLSQLFSLKGEDWKNLRKKFNPLFSSGKLKAMFPTILSEVDKLDGYVEKVAANNELFETKEMTYRYVLNIIGSVVFGLNIDILADPDHPFERMYKELLGPNKWTDLKNALQFVSPKLVDILRIPLLPTHVREFFLDVVSTTMKYRKEHNYRRNDFMQLMIDEGDFFTLNEITANCLIFYVAGADTSPFTTATCLYELALNKDLQTRVRNEIDEVLQKFDGVISYDSVNEMTFLDACVRETLRKYPGLPILLRECTKNYKIPNSKLTIKKGTSIFIPAMGLQYDPKHYPEPFKFIPDRFVKGSYEESICNKDAYLPFGDGPRKCIAVRMGFLFVKAAIVKLISKYEWETTDKKEVEFDNYSVGLSAKGGLLLKVQKRQK
ncbi:probable cytochrome P450 6d4 [Culicoides brevitarsis]|uniref:probable cytochrome P450 6d4 n=1 Tax=Culicoides brevitarsis TaxID=469753 RepID=UPI00307BA878